MVHVHNYRVFGCIAEKINMNDFQVNGYAYFSGTLEIVNILKAWSQASLAKKLPHKNKHNKMSATGEHRTALNTTNKEI